MKTNCILKSKQKPNKKLTYLVAVKENIIKTIYIYKTPYSLCVCVYIVNCNDVKLA